jgi:hypothetical protein
MVEKWRMKANETKSVHVIFTLKTTTCPPVQLNNKQLTKTEDVKYLGIHLDRKLTGVNTYLQREGNWSSNYPNCNGSLAENRTYHWKTSYSYTKRS